MNSFIKILNQWGENFLNFAWPMLWQSSLLIVVLFVVDFLIRRKIRASIRYSLWLVVLVKLCLPPTLALPTSPAWWLHKAPPPAVAKPTPHYTVTYNNDPLPNTPQTPLTAFVPPKPKMTNAAWLLAVSASVSLTLLGWLLVRWWQVTRQVRRSKTSERLNALAGEAQKIIGTKCNVQVKLTTNSISPAVCGLFHPAILIPQSLLNNFTDEQLRAVLLHELIHLRRRDVWVNFVQSLLQIFYWWHPLVWLANARIRRTREEAVDDAVMLALRDDAESYAPTLLEVAKHALNRPLVSLGLVGILESRHALRQRIERLVDFHPPRRAGLTLVSLLGILTFTAVAVPMGGEPNSNKNQSGSAPIKPSPPDIRLKYPKTVMITSQFYWMTSDDFKKLAVRSNFLGQKQKTNSFWSLTPDKFSELMETLKSFELHPIASPRLGVIDGEQGEMNIGNGTNSIELRCSPLVTGDSVRLVVEGKTIEGFVQGNPRFSTTNVFGADAIASNLGGIVIRSEPSSLYAKTNLFVTIRVMIYTNAVDADKLVQDAKLDYEMGKMNDAAAMLKTALALDPENTSAKYYLGLVLTNRPAKGFYLANESRRKILKKINTIRLDRVAFKALPLSEALQTLNKESIRLDADQRGINFMIDPNPGLIGIPTIDVSTGLPTTNSTIIDSGLINMPITINPPLTNISLGDALDALVMVAPKPIQFSIEDYGIVFSRSKPLYLLYSRIFGVESNRLAIALLNTAGQPTGSLLQVAKSHFSTLGVDFDVPGKSVFYNEKLGELFVRATLSDLDIVERALSELNVGAERVTPVPLLPPIRTKLEPPQPQIHIKARFLEVPDGTFQDLVMPNLLTNAPMNALKSETNVWPGLMADEKLKIILRALEAKPGVELLAEPEVVTISGRQTQMRATTIINIITNFTSWETATNVAVAPQTANLETGPVFDTIPTVLPDGYTVDLKATASMTEFLGYATPTNLSALYATNSAGEKIHLPAVLPAARMSRAPAHLRLYDGQTLVLFPDPKQMVFSKPDQKRDALVAEHIRQIEKADGNKVVIVLVTVNLVDPAGNRIHSDDEMPFAKDSVPPQ